MRAPSRRQTTMNGPTMRVDGKLKQLGPTCVVDFADGQTCRMTTACLPGKPVNAGRGLRLCVLAWQSRRARRLRTGKSAAFYRLAENPIMAARLRAWLGGDGMLPAINAIRFERNGQVIARLDPERANRETAALRAPTAPILARAA